MQIDVFVQIAIEFINEIIEFNETIELVFYRSSRKSNGGSSFIEQNWLENGKTIALGQWVSKVVLS